LLVALTCSVSTIAAATLSADLVSDLPDPNSFTFAAYSVEHSATPSAAVSVSSIESDPQYIQLQQRVVDLTMEVDQLRNVASGQGCGSIAAGCCPAPCDATGLFDDVCCPELPVLFGQLDVMFLRPRISGIGPVWGLAPSGGRLIDGGYDPALRFALEYRPAPTLGLRARYFVFDNDSPFVAPFQPAKLDIALETVDAEFVFHKNIPKWQFDFSGGLQYGSLEYSASLAGATGVGTVRFEGVGPVFSAHAVHQLGESGFSLFGDVRASFLMGNIYNASLLVSVPRAQIHDEFMQIYQNQLGVAWRGEVTDNVGIAVKAAWETQFWLNDTLSDDVYGIGSNLSLTGPAVSVELTY
jgi:hypothetical protein